MLVKYIFGLLLLLGCNIVLAQELNSVIYDRSHYQIKIKKSKKKKEWTTARKNREAQLIYSSNHLLFKSSQGVDTVFLSSINKTVRDFPYERRFYIVYNNNSDFITLLFCNRKNAREFKRFMQENGGHYRKQTIAKISDPIITVAVLVLVEWLVSF